MRPAPIFPVAIRIAMFVAAVRGDWFVFVVLLLCLFLDDLLRWATK